MSDDNKKQFLTKEKMEELKQELDELRAEKIPSIAKRIDEAKQMGDLSENAEYHQAREDMAWVQGRVEELENILSNAEIISEDSKNSNTVSMGSTVVLSADDIEKTYTIVGAQEADPLEGKISNESPLGKAVLGKGVGETVEVEIPAGTQEYKIVKIL